MSPELFPRLIKLIAGALVTASLASAAAAQSVLPPAAQSTSPPGATLAPGPATKLAPPPAADPSDELLDPDAAFKSSARLVGRDRIEIRYETAPGYYLYRDRLSFVVKPSTARLGKPKLPPGKVKKDEFFGRQVVYRHQTVVTLPVRWDGTGPLTLTADLQGCADLGVCYPPVRRTFALAP